jgi:hypothetical protein
MQASGSTDAKGTAALLHEVRSQLRAGTRLSLTAHSAGANEPRLPRLNVGGGAAFAEGKL